MQVRIRSGDSPWYSRLRSVARGPSWAILSKARPGYPRVAVECGALGSLGPPWARVPVQEGKVPQLNVQRQAHHVQPRYGLSVEGVTVGAQVVDLDL